VQSTSKFTKRRTIHFLNFNTKTIFLKILNPFGGRIPAILQNCQTIILLHETIPLMSLYNSLPVDNAKKCLQICFCICLIVLQEEKVGQFHILIRILSVAALPQR
jgi:hypothetical protein